MRSRSTWIAVIGLLISVVAVAGPATAATCATPAQHPGGDWTSYGRDLGNSRFQPEETSISPQTIGDLQRAFIFSTGGKGVITSTPIIADGCMYITASAGGTGWVFAVNADTGEKIWERSFLGNALTLLGGAIVGSPTIAGDKLIVNVSRRGSPYVVALNRADGADAWLAPKVVSTDPDAFLNAGAVVYNGLAFVGISGVESQPNARGAYAILDVATGGALVFVYRWTIPDEDFAKGYRGASIWTTAAVDTTTGHAYVGGGNPASKKIEHPHSNALLKIDLNLGSLTFGEIVAAYKGNVDQYFPGLDRQPACDAFGDHPQLQYVAWSITCVQLDLDFGASPSVFVDSFGNKLVGALQKSGVYHAVYADPPHPMLMAWTAAVGAPCFACNAGSASVEQLADGAKIYGVAVPPGQAYALNDRGRYQWFSPVLDGIHFFATSSAYGVVYSIDGNGFLNAFEAATGLPLAKINLNTEAGQPLAQTSSSGVAIARNTVYAPLGQYVFAYRLPPPPPA